MSTYIFMSYFDVKDNIAQQNTTTVVVFIDMRNNVI